MKTVQRQPICITRLKKKPSNYNITSPNDVTIIKDSRAQLCEVNPNIQNDNNPHKEVLYRQSSRQSIANTENHSYFLKQNLYTNDNYSSLNQDQQLIKRIKQLEILNEELLARNQQLLNRINAEQNQKAVLNARIEKLQKGLCKLESQFEQQMTRQSAKVQIPKLNTTQLRLNCSKTRQNSQVHRSSQGIGFRRMSFHQNSQYQYHSQDLSIKLKQYKNQLQIQKIKRINLQRELINCKENVKLQLKNQMELLQHKMDNLKQTIQRKDKEINQKEDLINRYIVKK